MCVRPATGAGGGGGRCTRVRSGEQITAASLCHPPTRNGTISSDEIFTTAGGMNELSIPNYLVWWFMAAQKHDNV